MDAGDAGFIDHTMAGSMAPMAINEIDSLPTLHFV
jgi:hypothetical protein